MADLIDIETYKQARGLSGTKDDDRLGILVVSVSQLIKTYCNNGIIDHFSTDKTEYCTVDWVADSIMLRESPVVAITEVWERATEADAYVQLTTSEYALDRRLDSVRRLGATWATGVESVKILYTAGYATPPEDLKLAVIDLITYYHKDEYKSNRTMQSSTLKNATTSSVSQSTGWPDHIKRVLDLYRIIE